MRDRRNRRLTARWARVAGVGAASAALALGATACGSSSDSDAPATGGGEASSKPVKLAFFAPLRGNSYIDAEIRGAKRAAKEGGAEITVMDGKGDPNVQYRQIQDQTAAKRMDAAIVFPLNGVLAAPVVEETLAAGIKVVCLFTPCGKNETSNDVQIDGLTLQIGSSPIREGEYLGEATVEACADKDPCKVAFISSFSIQATDKVRKNAWKAIIDKHPQIKLVASGDGKSSADVARTLVLDMLQANKDMSVIVNGGDQMGQGAEFAIKDSKLTGKVLIVGQGASEIGVKAVSEGRWYSTGILIPETEGYEAAKAAIAAAKGSTESKSIISQDLIDRDVKITKDTVDGFKAQWKG
jgi:ribose transport system substrate-binding protein